MARKIFKKRVKRKYRKRPGRRKKKLIIPFTYRIILVRNGKEIKKLGVYRTLKEVYTQYTKMLKEAKENVIFPVKYINSGKIRECKEELMILKKKGINDSDITLLRNEYGQFVPFNLKDKYDENAQFGKLSNKVWVIVDKHDYQREENFWVFGCHPIHDRKDFSYIYETFVYNIAHLNKVVTRIVAYQNKLIFDYGFDMNIVFCKNVSDALRLYTKVEEYATKDKIKTIIWNQRVSNREMATYWLNRLEKKTNFSREKLKRNSLRP